MENEDKRVELLSELLIRQDRFEAGLNKLGAGLDKSESGLDKLAGSQETVISIQERQERIFIKILEVCG